VAPKWPLAPASGLARHAGPAAVGDGHDYSAQVSGLISSATGSFHHVTPTITEKGAPGGSGSQVANAFSLQLNSQFFSNSPACAGASNPSSCQAWQQFVYTYENASTGYAFMQYWLIDYNASCPSGWMAYSTDCYTNSPASVMPAIKARQLGHTKLTGTAKAGGSDAVTVSVAGAATSVSNSDSVVDLAAFWNTAEWGVYGDGGGSEATFGANDALEAETALKATSSGAPTCVLEGFTAETNNLNLIHTPSLGKRSAPTIGSEQTDATTGTPSCAVAG
jgi:hypothetical protein